MWGAGSHSVLELWASEQPQARQQPLPELTCPTVSSYFQTRGIPGL